MAVPKRKKSRANTAARRSQWKAEVPTLVRSVENGRTVYRVPHRAHVVEDQTGTPLFMEYKGRRVSDA
jgi:large subunit ribosomal protein L32